MTYVTTPSADVSPDQSRLESRGPCFASSYPGERSVMFCTLAPRRAQAMLASARARV